MEVIKRDWTKVQYDKQKIGVAITKANDSLDEKLRISNDKIDEVVSVVNANVIKRFDTKKTDITVEEIQDIVEWALVKYTHYELAKAYIIYRYQRALKRKENTIDKSVLSLTRLEESDVSKENSNKDAKIVSTQRDLIAGEVSKDITKRYLLPEHIVKAHEDWVIHFHDMDYFMQNTINCCTVNMKDILDNWTVMNGKMVESPKSFQVACTVMTQVIAAISSWQYGGVSVDIKCLWKYLAKSEKKYREMLGTTVTKNDLNNVENLVRILLQKELESGVQTIQYQINTLMTTNGQSPFVTLLLNIDIENDEYYKYTALIVEEILKQRIKGIKNEHWVYVTPAFPKLIYVLYEHNNLSGGQYDDITKLAAECTTKRMYPDYISAKKMKAGYGAVFAPMGCRAFLSPRRDKDGKLQFEWRFNQGVVTINLPQVALSLKDRTEEEYFKELDKRLEIAKEALLCRHNNLKELKPMASPIHWMYGGVARKKANESIEDILVGGYSTLTLGYIGFYETSKLMTGESNTSEKGKAFSMKLMKHLKDKVDQWKKETNIGFALYWTPAESLCYRFAKIDKEKFWADEDITGKNYYTNSYHCDVREDMDAISKLSYEAPFQELSTGGCISYVEIPNLVKNPEAVESLIKYIYDNIQYAEFNTKTDYCANCGYDWELKIKDKIKWYCPNCWCEEKQLLTVVRRSCFTKDNLVLTETGYKQIADIEIGEKVLTKKNRYMPVVDKMTFDNKETVKVISSFSWTLHCTPDHNILVVEKQWNEFSKPFYKEAWTLTSQDYLVSILPDKIGEVGELNNEDRALSLKQQLILSKKEQEPICIKEVIINNAVTYRLEKNNNAGIIIKKNYVYSPVKSVEKSSDETVYSLTVLDDASYTVQNAIVKNCGYIWSNFRNDGKTQEIDKRVLHVN